MLILNTYTIIILFIAALTGLLAVPIGYLSLKTYLQAGHVKTEEERDTLTDRSSLLLLIASIVLAVKLAEWPLFYVALQDLIPHIHGAMCIFGVTQSQPILSGVAQVLKPLVFFGIGGWLILRRLGPAHEFTPLFRTKHLLLAAVSLLIFTDSAMDLLYFTSFETGADVACCTTVFDLAEGKRAALTSSLIGKGYERALLPLYFFTNIIVLAFFAYVFIRVKKVRRLFLRTTAAGAILAAINAVITIAALFEVISPRAMDLPYHHCIYCMWQYEPLSMLMTALFVIGTFSPGWALLLAVAGRQYPDELVLRGYQRKLAVIVMGCIGISVCIAVYYVFLK